MKKLKLPRTKPVTLKDFEVIETHPTKVVTSFVQIGVTYFVQIDGIKYRLYYDNCQGVWVIRDEAYSTIVKCTTVDKLFPKFNKTLGIPGNTPTFRPIYKIAEEIKANWKNVWYGAAPYLQAMSQLNSITDTFGDATAKEVILYFLSNAEYWRGETARRIKNELNSMIK